MIDEKAWPEPKEGPDGQALQRAIERIEASTMGFGVPPPPIREVQDDPRIDATVENVNKLVAEARASLEAEMKALAEGKAGAITSPILAKACSIGGMASAGAFVLSLIAIPAEVEMPWSLRTAAWSAIALAAFAVVGRAPNVKRED